MSSLSGGFNYIDLINACDGHLKAGRIADVTTIINSVNFNSVPREFRQSLAKICRRSGLISQGLRLLQPVIRHEKQVIEPPTQSEICEYSVLLSRNGSIPEALNLLRDVDTAMYPEALLYTAYCHISHWDYSKAVPYLEEFLLSKADDYSKLIARVNLVASYIVTSQLVEAENLLSQTVTLAEQAGATRLVGNCFELWGQVYFWQKDFMNARKALERATQVFGNGQSYDQLLVYKTHAIIAALESNSTGPLLKFKKIAQERKHRESIREADLFLLKIDFQQDSLDHLMFGTPMKAYRDRIQAVLQAPPSSTYLFGKAGGRCLDLQSGKLDKKQSLNAGKKIHQVLASLMKDYYVPRNLGTLFSEIYPDEYFDVNSSPFRVRQLMLRTRQWLQEYKLPVSILHLENAYELTVNGQFGIRMHLESVPVEPVSSHWQVLYQHFQTRNFSAEQATAHLCCSRTSFRRWVDEALINGLVVRIGAGKATRYQLQVQSSMGASVIIAA